MSLMGISLRRGLMGGLTIVCLMAWSACPAVAAAPAAPAAPSAARQDAAATAEGVNARPASLRSPVRALRDDALLACIEMPGYDLRRCRPGLLEMRNARSVTGAELRRDVSAGSVAMLWTSAPTDASIADEPFYYMTRDGEMKQVDIYTYDPFRHETYLGSVLDRHDVTVVHCLTWERFVADFPHMLSVAAIVIYLALTVVMVIMLRRQMSGGGRFRTKPISRKNMKTFDDVAGNDYVVSELREIADIVRKGIGHGDFDLIPRGILLSGPPGTGKTLMASALATAISAPMYSVSGADFVEVFVGTGSRRIRQLARKAGKHRIAVVFIDEIDIIASRRSSGVSDVGREYEQTLTSLLTVMDGMDNKRNRRRRRGNIIFVGATNRPEVLDDAILRPGRFDRRVTVDLPDVKARSRIAGISLRGVKITEGLTQDYVGQATPGMSGADVSNVVRQARLLAARRGAAETGPDDIEEAVDLVQLGTPNLSTNLNIQDRRITAFHEAGHAIVALRTRDAMPVRKITIIPRGQALGMVSMADMSERKTHSRDALYASLIVAMGGRAAEELVFGAGLITSGAAMDIKQANRIARMMGGKLGMFEGIGMVDAFPDEGQSIVSEDLKSRLDHGVTTIVEKAHRDAMLILKDNQAGLYALVEALFVRKTLNAKEAIEILDRAESATIETTSRVDIDTTGSTAWT